MKKIAVVTGGNRGIGLEICRQLSDAGDVHVVLTARDAAKAAAAAASLRDNGHDVSSHSLDVTDPQSIAQLIKAHERIDILVNNAGIFIDKQNTPLDVDVDTVRQTLETNLLGPVQLIQAVVPLMQQHNYGRIVNVSSMMASLEDMGMPGNALAYRMSKTALNAMTRIIAGSVADYNIQINAASPGWVRTDMGGPTAARSVAEGADTITWLALQGDDGPNGGFFHDRKPAPW